MLLYKAFVSVKEVLLFSGYDLALALATVHSRRCTRDGRHGTQTRRLPACASDDTADTADTADMVWYIQEGRLARRGDGPAP